MSAWKRFWKAALYWSIALVTLLTAYALAIQLSGDGYRGPGGILLALHGLAGALGGFFPLIGFFAALGTPPLPRSGRAEPARVAIAAIAATAGIAEYLWLAFVEPLSRVVVFRWSAARAGVSLDPEPVASTQIWIANQMVNPAVGEAEARYFGWFLHLPNAMGLLTLLLVILGFLIAQRATTSPQRWTMAVAMGVIVAPMLLGSRQLSIGYGVPPEATTYGMLFIPLVLLAFLTWIEWTDRAEATAIPTA